MIFICLNIVFMHPLIFYAPINAAEISRMAAEISRGWQYVTRFYYSRPKERLMSANEAAVVAATEEDQVAVEPGG